MKIAVKYYGKLNKKLEDKVINLIGSIRFTSTSDADDDDGKGAYTELMFRRIRKNEVVHIQRGLPKGSSVVHY